MVAMGEKDFGGSFVVEVGISVQLTKNSLFMPANSYDMYYLIFSQSMIDLIGLVICSQTHVDPFF